MSSVTDNVAVTPIPAKPLNFSLWAQVAIATGLLVFLYHGIVVALVRDWWNNPDFSHGFFVPCLQDLWSGIGAPNSAPLSCVRVGPGFW